MTKAKPIAFKAEIKQLLNILIHSLYTEQEIFLRKARSKGIVFFVIRPDGVDSFNTYYEIIQTYNRTATRRIDAGYEPVDSDWEINYPKN